MKSQLNFRVAALLTLAPLLWAGNAIVGRLAVGAVPPMALNFARWTIALALLWPLGQRAFQDKRAIAQRWRYLAVLSLFGMGCYSAFQYLALHTSTPLNVTLIAASMPIGMISVGACFYGAQPRWQDLLGATLSLVGVALVISRGDLGNLTKLHFVPGDVLMIAAVICWSFYSWLLVKPPQHMRGEQRPEWNWAEFLLLQCVFGTVWGAGFAGAEA